MIKENELREAIAECQGERNPNANTCIKLAAYYSILDHMTPQDTGVSFASSPAPTPTPTVSAIEYPPAPVMPDTIQWEGESEFAEEVYNRPVSDVMPIMEELMQTVQLLHPRLYDSVLRKIRGEN